MAGDGQVIGDLHQRVYSGWVCLISEMGVTGIASPSVCLTLRSTPEFQLCFVLRQLLMVCIATAALLYPPHPLAPTSICFQLRQ